MKITQEQFNSAQKTFTKKSLSVIQKQTMLSNIYRDNKEFAIKPIVSPFISHFTLFRQKIAVSLAIIILLISGTSYTSAMSLPGDLFYDVKVDIIEPIGLVVRANEVSRNEYKISLLEKRVNELNKLKEKGDIYENSQKASFKATNKNVKELEKSAIFNEKGQNAIVSEKIKSYNELIDVNLKIETSIKIDDQDFEDEKELELVDIINKEEDIIIETEESLTEIEEDLIDTEEDITDIIDEEVDESNEIEDKEVEIDSKEKIKIENEKELPLNTESNLNI